MLKKEAGEGLEYEGLLNEEQRLWNVKTNVITVTRAGLYAVVDRTEVFRRRHCSTLQCRITDSCQ